MTRQRGYPAYLKGTVVASSLLFLIVFSAILVVGRGQAEDEGAPAPRGVPVRPFRIGTASVHSGRDLVASGTLAPIRQSTLGFAVGGVVEKISADEGSRVAAGAALASLDPTPFRAAVDQGEARLRFLESRWSRSEQLAKSGAIAEEELDADASGRREAAAAVDLAHWNLSRSVVSAPFPGSITKRFVETGEVVAPGTPAFELIATDSLKLQVSVPARDLSRIGSQARVSSPDFPGMEFSAHVDHRPVTADPRSSSVPVTLHLNNPEFKLLPGTIATVRFLLEGLASETSPTPANQVRIPLSTIRTTGSGPIVFRIVDNRAQGIAVQLGAVREDHVWVQGELRPGDELVLEAPDRLRDNDLLIVVREG